MGFSVTCGCGRVMEAVGDDGRSYRCPNCGARAAVQAPAGEPQPKRRFRWQVWAVPALTALNGLIFAAFGAYPLWKAAEARRWPTTPGRVEESRVVEVEERDSDGDKSTAYRVDAVYNYSVEGRPYKGSRISPSGSSWSSNRSRALEQAARYGPGTEVRVSYNPKDPSDATLETDAGSGAIVTLALSPVFFVLAIVLFVVLKKRFPP